MSAMPPLSGRICLPFQNPTFETFRMSARMTLSEAEKVSGSVVYGLAVLDGPVFYVGKSRNTRRRFRDYARRTGNNLHLMRRLKEAGAALRVEILSRNPVDLDKAEADAIIARAPELANIKFNGYRNPTGLHVPVNLAHNKMATCPCCDGPIDKPRHKYCQACTTKHLRHSSDNKLAAHELLALSHSD